MSRMIARGRQFESVRGLQKSPANGHIVLTAAARFRRFRGYETGTFWDWRALAGTCDVSRHNFQVLGTLGRDHNSESSCKQAAAVARAGGTLTTSFASEGSKVHRGTAQSTGSGRWRTERIVGVRPEPQTVDRGIPSQTSSLPLPASRSPTGRALAEAFAPVRAHRPRATTAHASRTREDQQPRRAGVDPKGVGRTSRDIDDRAGRRTVIAIGCDERDLTDRARRRFRLRDGGGAAALRRRVSRLRRAKSVPRSPRRPRGSPSTARDPECLAFLSAKGQ